jgi:hypothetical protein
MRTNSLWWFPPSVLLNGSSASSILSSGAATMFGTDSGVFVIAGIDGQRYDISDTATPDDSEVAKDDFLAIVGDFLAPQKVPKQ